MKATAEIKGIAEDILKETDLFLVDIKVSKSNVIEVYIDSAQGVDIRVCIEINKALEAQLNREEEDFDLIVSSAGIGYPFKVPGQFLKNIGKKVSLKLSDSSKLTGILKAYDGKSVIVEYEGKIVVEGKKKKESVKMEKEISLDEIKEIQEEI